MEDTDILREPVELIDEDLDEVAGGGNINVGNGVGNRVGNGVGNRSRDGGTQLISNNTIIL